MRFFRSWIFSEPWCQPEEFKRTAASSRRSFPEHAILGIVPGRTVQKAAKGVMSEGVRLGLPRYLGQEVWGRRETSRNETRYPRGSSTRPFQTQKFLQEVTEETKKGIGQGNPDGVRPLHVRFPRRREISWRHPHYRLGAFARQQAFSWPDGQNVTQQVRVRAANVRLLPAARALYLPNQRTKPQGRVRNYSGHRGSECGNHFAN
jgi:hypothetical protein